MYFRFKVKYLNGNGGELTAGGIGFAESYAEAAEKIQEIYGNKDIIAMDITWLSDDAVIEMQDLASGLMDDEPYEMGNQMKVAIDEIAAVAEAFEEE